MKKLFLLFLTILLAKASYSQRVLEWSIGDIEVSCDAPVEICYPMQVAIDDGSQNPQLSTSTIRIFYDAGYLSNLSVANVENGYTVSGFNQSADVYGGVFNFAGGGGVFAQFDLLVNDANPIDLSTSTVHVLDFCFTLKPGVELPLCSPIVFDNNHCGWDGGIGQDDGYLVNDAGLVGTYYLNSDNSDAILADDEVINYLWDENPGFDCRVDALSDDVGMTSTIGCIQDVCNADIAIVKTSSLDPGGDGVVSAGDIITYTYTVTNTGPATLYDVVVDENVVTFSGTGSLPIPGLETITINGGSSSDASVDGSIDVLAPADIAQFSASYAITQNDIDAGVVTNQATATGTPAGGDPVTDISDDPNDLTNVDTDSDGDPDDPTVTLIPQTNAINIVKDSPSDDTYAAVGDVIDYTLTVTNAGNTTIYGVSVTDPDADAGSITFVSGDANSNGALDVTETWSYTATHTIDQSDIDSGSFTNTADVDGSADTDGDGAGDTPVNDDDTDTVTADQTNAINIVKDSPSDDTYAAVGDVIDYTLTVTNAGNTTIYGVSVTDPDADAGSITFVSGDANSNGALDVTETWSYTATHTIDQSDIDSGSFTNTADVDGSADTDGDGAGDTPVNDDDTDTVTADQTNAINIVKDSPSDDTYAAVGDVIDYTLTVTNAGNTTIYGVSVTDPDADAGSITFVSGDANSNGALDVTETWSYTATHTIDQSDIDSGSFTNTADVDGSADTDGDGAGDTPVNDDDTDTVTADQTNAINIVKDSPSDDTYAAVGDVIDYTITVTNAGNTTIYGVSVTDPDADAGSITFVSGDANSNGALDVTETWSYTATHTIDQSDIDSGSFTNTADVDGSADTDGDGAGDTPVNDDDTDTVTADQTNAINIVKDSPSDDTYAAVGDVIDYTITVTNAGNTTIYGISVTDPDADAGSITFVSGDANSNGALDVTETWSYTATHTIDQSDIDSGSFTNTADVDGSADTDGDGAGDTPVNDDDTDTVTADQTNAINIVKDSPSDDTYAAVGDVIDYTITVTNAGNTTIYGISVTDPDADAGSITFVSGDANSNGALDVTETWSYTATHTIDQSDIDSGSFTNTADVDGSADTDGDGAGDTPVNDDDTDTVTADQTNAINIVKDSPSDDTYAAVGDVIDYTITVTNAGNTTIYGVSVTDPDADAGSITFVSGDANSNGALDVTETWSYTATHTIDQSDIDSGSFTNTADVDGSADTDGDGAGDTPVNDDDTDTVTADQTNAINIVKDSPSDDTYAAVGDVIDYTLTVTNAGNTTIYGVSVTDPDADAGSITFVSGDANSNGALDVTETWSYTATHTIDQSDIDSGSFTNTADVDGSADTDGDGAGDTPVNDDDTDTVTADQTNAINIVKDSPSDDTYAAVGDVIDYTITVTNAGNTTIYGVSVTDPDADAGSITFVSGDANSNGALDVTETWSYTATHTIDQSDIDSGSFTNTADVDGSADTDGDGAGDTPVNDDDTDTVTADQTNAISIVKDSPSDDTYAAVGDVIDYTITVTNAGNTTIYGVSVTDPDADAGSITFVSGDANSNGALDVTETWSYTATHTIDQSDIDSGSFTNTADVDGSADTDGDGAGDTPVNDDDTDTVTADQTNAINIVKDSPSDDTYAAVGDVIDYTITVTNAGNTTIYSVSVTDPDADAGSITFVSGDANSNGALDVTETWSYTATHTIDQSDIDSGSFTNTADVDGSADTDGDGAGDTPVNDDDTDTVTADQTNAISIVKDSPSDDTYAAVGDVIDYTITVSNAGNTTIYGVAVTDPDADAGSITFVSGDANSNGALDVTETWSYTATHTIDQSDIDSGSFTNTADVDGSADTDGDGAGDTPVNDDDTDTVTADQTNAINIVKDSPSDDTYAAVGDVIDYTITVTNAGNTTIYGVSVTDPDADAGSITFVSGDANSNGALDVTETWSYTATHTIDQSDIDSGSFTNTADVDGSADTDSDGAGDTPVNDDDTDTVTADQTNAINIVKDSPSDDTYAAVGDVIDYTITVTNAGNTTIYGVSVTDPDADAGSITFVSGDANSNGALDVTETWSYTATHTIDQSDIDSGSFTNTADVDGSADTDGDGAGDTPVNDDDTDTVTADQTNAISIVKDSPSDDTYAAVGDVIDYTITVTNAGNTTIYGVSVTDPDADVGSITFVSGDANSNGALDVTETWSYTATHTIDQSDIDSGSFTNTADVDGSADTDGDGAGDTPVNDDDTDTVTADQTNAINIVKDSPSDDTYAAVGDVIDYTITVTNAGNTTIYGVSVTDPDADAGSITFVSGDANSNGALDVTETWSYTATHTIDQSDIDSGSFTNTADVDGSADTDGDGAGDTPVNDDDTDTVTADQTNAINIVKDSPSDDTYAAVGDVIDYTITVTNAGNTTIYGVSVTDPDADAGSITFVSGDANSNGALDVTETWSYTATHTIDQSDIDSGSFTNTADVDGSADTDGDGAGDTPVNDDDTDTVTADQSPDISLLKISLPLTDTNSDGVVGGVGDEINYNFIVTNTGNVTLTNVTVTDLLVSVTGTPIAVLEPGEIDNSTFTATYTITLADVDAGQFVNSATVTGTDSNNDPVTDTSDDPNDPTDVDPDSDGDPDDPTVTPLCPVFNDVIVSEPTDCGETDGSIIIDANGADLQYSIDGGFSFSDNNQFFGLGAGSYTVVIRSGLNGCEVQYGDVIFTVPDSPQFDNVFITNVSDCGANDGQLVILASGGTGSYEYSIDGGDTWSNLNTFMNLEAGFYPIRIRNADETCEIAGPTVQLVPPAAPMIDFVSVTNPSGCGVENGVITVFASGGDVSLPLQYSINGGSSWTTNNTFIDLSEGTYEVKVRNGNATCESGGAFTVLSAKTNPVITGVFATDASCESTGTITVNADGGEDPGNYLISIDGLNYESTSKGSVTFTDLAPGSYTIRVQNQDGSCEVVWPVDIVIDEICADLMLTKTVDVTEASVGDVVVFTITVTNDGPSDATGIAVTDQLPAGYTYTGDSPSQGSYSDVTGIWMVGDLLDQASAILEITATVTGTNDYINLAQITAADQDDIDSDPASDENTDDLNDGVLDDDESTVGITLCVEFDLWVYLEGSLIVPQTAQYQVPMRTTLNDSRLLPGQFSENPFTGNIYTAPLGANGQIYNIAPWNYAGSEGAAFDSGGSSANADAGYPSTVTDWVLVSLRSDPENGAETVCQRAALLHQDGRLEFVDDADCCNLDLSQSYYIVIEHRNHLIVMSHEAVPVVNGKLTYDFRNKQSYVNDPFNSGSFIGQKEVLPGVYAMFAGNGDQTSVSNEDTDITASDYAKWLNNGPENRTYNLIDYNMDGDVSALDFDLWQSNSPRFTSVKRD